MFETMVFPGNASWHYATWEDAEQGHRAIVASLREGKEP